LRYKLIHVPLTRYLPARGIIAGMRRQYFFLGLTFLSFLAFFSACDRAPKPPNLELPSFFYKVHPGTTVDLPALGSEDIGPDLALIRPPEWLSLIDASGSRVQKCPLYQGGCALRIEETALAGSYDVKARLEFKNGSAITQSLSLQVEPTITLRPQEATLKPKEQLQFHAKVLGGETGAVAWSATCGEITDNGLYTAPDHSATCKVKATSLEFEDLWAIARVEVKAGATLFIDVTPDDAEVEVNGPEGFHISFTGDRSLTDLSPGRYLVTARHPGYFSNEKEVVLEEGDEERVEIVLEPKPSFDLVPHLVLTNEGTDSDARQTTVDEGTVVTVYWGMQVLPESALDEARAAAPSDGVAVELYWKGAGDADYQRLARIYQKPGDKDRVYALPPAEAGENRVRVVVDADHQVTEADEENNIADWIIIGRSSGATNQPPEVELRANPSQGSIPLTVQFKAVARDPDGKVVRYEWDFDGDGTYDLSGDKDSATYTYEAEGTYTAAVRVTDDKGATAIDRVKIKAYDEATDGEPPTVEWVRPTDGAKITGPVTLEVRAEGDQPTVDFYINETLVATDSVPPYTYDWSPTAADNGSAILKAVAKDPDGEASAEITVEVEVVDRLIWQVEVSDYGTPQARFALGESGAFVGTNTGYALKVTAKGELWVSEPMDEPVNAALTPYEVGEAVFVHTPKGYLVALSLKDGKPIWAEDFGVSYTLPPPPAVVTQGVVWVAGSNPPDSGENRCLYALDPVSGDKRAEPLCFDHYIEALVSAGDDKSVVAVEEMSTSKLALHRVYLDDEGKVVSVDSNVLSAILADGVEPTVSDGYVYIPSQFKEIVRVDLDKLQNVTQIDSGINHKSPIIPVKVSGTLKYFAVNGGGRLYLLDASTGETVWSVDAGMYAAGAPVYNSDRSEVYAVSWDGVVQAYDLDGALRFSYQLPGSGGVALPPVYMGSDVLVVARYRTIFGVDLSDR